MLGSVLAVKPSPNLTGSTLKISPLSTQFNKSDVSAVGLRSHEVIDYNNQKFEVD
jgi:hypothetical protein